MVFTEVIKDENNKEHKSYKYLVKCSFGDNFIYLSFEDEAKAYDDTDYHGYVTENEKMDKIYNMIIYYDSDVYSTVDLEKDVVAELLKCYYSPDMANQFFTIKTNQYGYALKASYIKYTDIDVELNYGKKFAEIHEQIIDKLLTQSYGLFLFHGKTGSGKTFYLRKLIHLLSKDKTIIYMPSYMIENVTDPEFISFISNFKNPILLLEDAENILTSRNGERTQAVSNILNMTDGLLNDFMNVQIIATFNGNSKSIDEALKRAGRLKVNYKFDELSIEDANILSSSLGLDKRYTKPTALAEIYEGTNQVIVDDLEEKTIGFKRNN
jgi:hypothetical protein